MSAVRASLLSQLSWVLAAAAPFEVGDACLTQALAIADKLGDPALRGYCLLGKSLNRFCWMHQKECLEAAELLRATGSLWEEAVVLGFAQIGLVGVGRFADTRRVVAHLEPLAERLGNIPALLQCGRAKNGMVDYAETGDIDALEAHAWADLKLATDGGLPWVDQGYDWLGLAYFLRGDWDAARGHFEKAADCAPPGIFDGWARGLLFEFRALRRRAGGGARHARRDGGQPHARARPAQLVGAVEHAALGGRGPLRLQRPRVPGPEAVGIAGQGRRENVALLRPEAGENPPEPPG